MDKVAFDARRKELDITIKTLCDEMGIDESTYYRKMQKNGETFTMFELSVIKRLFKLDAKSAVDMLLP